jgi:glycerol-3-phosphate O-acyltransferase/dihydroxyacetone phosphate acyltransferase
MLRGALDRVIGALCRFALGIFFRRIEVVGRERLPDAGPFLVVANHVNGLIDPLFVFGPLRLRVRMLGKSTLWKIPVLAQLLDLAGVLPVHRPGDPGADPARNRETFERCFGELARGGRIAVFPEGTSHDDPRLRPLKTGVARIVLGAELARGPLGVRVVPVGLVFEQRERFRSRALVVVGEPIDPTPEIALARADETDAIRALTERVAAALERVTLNYGTWEDARLIELAARIAASGEGRRARDLAHDFELRRALGEGLAELRATRPGELAQAVSAAREYERLLRAAGVSDAQVAARVRPLPAAVFVLRAAGRLLLAAPVAALGTALHVVPWLFVDRISRSVRDEPNQVATFKLFPAIVIYPATWLAEALAAWRAAGLVAAAMIVVGAPLSGWVALRWHERRGALWRESRAFLLLRGRRRVAEALRARRAAVAEELDRLIAVWRAAQEPAEPDPDPSSSSNSRS